MQARTWIGAIVVVAACGSVETHFADAPTNHDAPIDTRPVDAALTLADQRVMYTGGPTAVQQAMSIKLDGTGIQTLTTNATQTTFAAPTLDGTKFAYAFGNDIFLQNMDGTGLRRLTTGTGFRPAFSGDGSKIAFASTRAGGTQVFVMTTASGDAGTTTRITPTGVSNTFPAFSPDGTKVTFTDLTANEIMLVDLTTMVITNLTNNPAMDATSAFSLDGTRIVFSSDRSGSSQIWMMNADGSNPTQITTDAAPNKFHPSFDRDGSHVVYFAGTTRNLFIAAVAGGAGTPLTVDAAGVQEKLGSWIF